MFSPIDLATRVSLVRPHCASNKPTAVIQQFKTENNNARKALCTVATLLNLVRRFEEIGSVLDKARSRRPSDYGRRLEFT